MKTTLLAIVVAIAVPSLGLADDMNKGVASADKTKPAATKLTNEDVLVLSHLQAVNKAEIELGKLAQKRGTDPVKKYGFMLATDHQESDKNLTAFAKSKGLSKIPAETKMDDTAKQAKEEMKAAMAELKKVKGAEFDRQFLTMMVTDHDREVNWVAAAIPNIKDPELVAEMKDVQPMLQRHADLARELQKNAPTASADKTAPNAPVSKK